MIFYKLIDLLLSKLHFYISLLRFRRYPLIQYPLKATKNQINNLWLAAILSYTMKKLQLLIKNKD